MKNLAWGLWLQGLISAIANGLIIALVALIVLKQPPSNWELLVIAIFPAAVTFLSFIKQTPPPIGEKEVKPSNPQKG